MFDRMYYKNPYLFEFTAKVEDIIQEKDYYKLVLSDTIFYPEGGGQPADIGTIDDEEVFDVQEEDGIVYHYVKKDFEIGKEVELKIDAINRIENMKGHTAEHIVSGTVCSKFGANNVGFHMGKDIITMDFDKVLTKENIAEVERKANKVIYMNYQVIEDIVTPKEAERIEYRSKKELDGDIRLVSIPSIDVCACCGLHVERTGEIGIIKIMSFEKYKSGTRVYMISSRRALREFNFEQGILNELSQKYSAPFEELLERIRRGQ